MIERKSAPTNQCRPTPATLTVRQSHPQRIPLIFRTFRIFSSQPTTSLTQQHNLTTPCARQLQPTKWPERTLPRARKVRNELRGEKESKSGHARRQPRRNDANLPPISSSDGFDHQSEIRWRIGQRIGGSICLPASWQQQILRVL